MPFSFTRNRTGAPFFAGAQNHVKIAAVKPEHDLAGRRLELASLASDLPRSAESPLIEAEPRSAPPAVIWTWLSSRPVAPLSLRSAWITRSDCSYSPYAEVVISDSSFCDAPDLSAYERGLVNTTDFRPAGPEPWEGPAVCHLSSHKKGKKRQSLPGR